MICQCQQIPRDQSQSSLLRRRRQNPSQSRHRRPQNPSQSRQDLRRSPGRNRSRYRRRSLNRGFGYLAAAGLFSVTLPAGT
jgi:hypothetical protein